MTANVHDLTFSPTTQAAEGLMRRRWSVAEIESMVSAGVILEDERFELIGGEVVPMSPKGQRHELLKIALIDYWVPRKHPGLRIAPETTFRLDAHTFLEPDFLFYRVSDGIANLRSDTALLAVEIAHSSLGYDLGRKVLLYAIHGIREVWVIDAVKLETHVHRRPMIGGYAEKFVVPADTLLKADFAPELAVALATLHLV
ncbi:MAG TPA: Uma2 family endonuclease [Aestuariivirga sp.]|nr:Uma2 family endonuclease [Aestuariivirga sp.]